MTSFPSLQARMNRQASQQISERDLRISRESSLSSKQGTPRHKMLAADLRDQRRKSEVLLKRRSSMMIVEEDEAGGDGRARKRSQSDADASKRAKTLEKLGKQKHLVTSQKEIPQEKVQDTNRKDTKKVQRSANKSPSQPQKINKDSPRNINTSSSHSPKSKKTSPKNSKSPSPSLRIQKGSSRSSNRSDRSPHRKSALLDGENMRRRNSALRVSFSEDVDDHVPEVIRL